MSVASNAVRRESPAADSRLARYAGATALALVIALLALLSPTPALAQAASPVDAPAGAAAVQR